MKKQGILLFIFWQTCWLATAQAEVLERRIDVQFAQTPLKIALVEVAKKANFEWSYNASILAGERRVSLTARDWTVREVLHSLLGEGFEFRSSGNYLIIKKLKRPPAELSGYVRDPRTGERIAGATVFDRRTLRATTTDSNGFYQLKIKKASAVVVAKLEFRDTVVQVSQVSPRFVSIGLQPVRLDSLPPAGERDFEEILKKDLQQAGERLSRFFRATLENWQEQNLRDSFHRDFQVSFLPKMGTNHTLSGQVSNDYSLNVLAGFSRGVEKLEVGGIGNFTRKSVRGVQIGGIFNQNGGDTRGVQIAGIQNWTADSLRGVQVGGITNFAKNSVRGNQFGGIGNVARHGTASVQIGGIFNSADSLGGVQIGGIFNRARRVRGVQIGLVNSAGGCDCLQIGLVNRVGRRWRPFFNW